ncbi:hypothetical protein C8F04DRAFT_1184539 [Mycena alexandri]|uniref:Uncharacterized protein n=1 Tax=Mycena alexandri TaxID=1745969 RepID=A0AAD6SUV4_9AGAR|nr:hypothetical protein C8F04DRAFT_1184539 [Mycena alexandri]
MSRLDEYDGSNLTKLVVTTDFAGPSTATLEIPYLPVNNAINTLVLVGVRPKRLATSTVTKLHLGYSNEVWWIEWAILKEMLNLCTTLMHVGFSYHTTLDFVQRLELPLVRSIRLDLLPCPRGGEAEMGLEDAVRQLKRIVERVEDLSLGFWDDVHNVAPRGWIRDEIQRTLTSCASATSVAVRLCQGLNAGNVAAIVATLDKKGPYTLKVGFALDLSVTSSILHHKRTVSLLGPVNRSGWCEQWSVSGADPIQSFVLDTAHWLNVDYETEDSDIYFR